MTNAQSKDGEVTRREFCNCLMATSAGLFVMATTSAADASVQQGPSLAYPPLKIDGAERLMPGSSLSFTYPSASDPAILIRSSDGEYCAFGQKCSHKGCSVYFERNSNRLECPCHKGAYSAQTGLVLYGPPLRPLGLIVLQVRAGGEVWAVGRGVVSGA